MSAPTLRLSRMRQAPLMVAALLAMVCLGVVSLSPVHADTRSQLASARARLSALIKKVASEEKVVRAMEAQASEIAASISTVQDQIATTEKTIIHVEGEIQVATAHLEATQAQLDQRARVAYENGPGTGLEFLLGSTSMADMANRLEIVNSAAQSDNTLISQLQNQRAQLSLQQQRLQRFQVRQRATQADLATRQQALQGKLTQAQQVVNKLKGDKQAAQHLVTKLKAKLRQEYLARLAQAQQGSGGGGSISGVLLVCPVDQPHAYSDDFGAFRYSGGFHRHAGNDISAPLGAPIRAPFAGTVLDSSDPNGGNDVYVQGAQGFVFNAHLSRYGATGTVSAGTIIGYVGATGDATGPHDHFEWHPNVIPAHAHVSPYGYSVINGAIDPFPYLNSVC